MSHFHNVRILNDCVYCTFCKSLIGKKAVDHDILFINRHRLLRIDPRTITTHCLPTAGSRNSTTHGHTLLIASIENAVTDPIPRLSLRSRNNTSRTIKTTCQEVKNFLADSSRSRSNRRIAGANQPVNVTNCIEISDNENESVHTTPSSIFERPTVIVSTMEAARKISQPDPTDQNKTSNASSDVPLQNVNNAEFNTFLQNQPSTSGLVYEAPVQNLILNRARSNSSSNARINVSSFTNRIVYAFYREIFLFNYRVCVCTNIYVFIYSFEYLFLCICRNFPPSQAINSPVMAHNLKAQPLLFQPRIYPFI